MKLLSTNNAKTVKGEKKNWKTYIMYLSPYTKNSKGINLCSHASAGCVKACLFGSGHGSMTNVINARTNRTELFLSDKKMFFKILEMEINIAIIETMYKGENLAIRLNGTSDIPFEKYKYFDNGTKNVFEKFPDVTFYDYTKNPKRFDNELPNNYHLTFSRSENNEAISFDLLDRGFNVAVVFDKLIDVYNGYKVINGDEDDLTFLKGNGNILGLKYKRLTSKGAGEVNKEAIESGFVVKVGEYVETKVKVF